MSQNMGNVLVPLLPYLDPRPATEATAEPIEQAVNIPFDQLPRRMHELPPKNSTVQIASDGAAAWDALDLLARAEREPTLAPNWQYGPSTPGRLWEPNPFLLAQLADLSHGRALDLACGTGRDAVALTAYGWSVVATDILDDALDRGRDLASRYLPEAQAKNIEWHQADLEREPPAGSFDLISMFFYLDRDLLAKLPDLLTPGGHVIVETFTAIHREERGKPRRPWLVLELGELPTLLPGLETRSYDEGWHNDRHTARGLFRKPA